MAWEIYEMHSDTIPIQGVGCRGRIHLFALTHGLRVKAWNIENGKVRFAVPKGTNAKALHAHLKKIYIGLHIAKVNPDETDSKR